MHFIMTVLVKGDMENGCVSPLVVIIDTRLWKGFSDMQSGKT